MLIPSQIDPTMAPNGKHYMSVFVQYCPYKLADGEWTTAKRQAFGDTVIDTIAQHSPDFKDLILHAEIRTPHDIEAEVGLTEGNIFQGELTFDQLLFNRPIPGYAQYRAPLHGMYMCGASTTRAAALWARPAPMQQAQSCAICGSRLRAWQALATRDTTASWSAAATTDWCAPRIWRAAVVRCWCWRRPNRSAGLR
jgi:phytoene dehydrogenase-like protein